MSKPCEYCGHDLPFGIDKKTRQTRSRHFDSCEVRLSEKLQESEKEIKDEPPQFPAMLRKMWSGREVQDWINEHWVTPPQRTWVGLTDEEIVLIVAECAASHQHTDIHFARAIEAKLRSKND
jgi:hypothetical protein